MSSTSKPAPEKPSMKFDVANNKYVIRIDLNYDLLSNEVRVDVYSGDRIDMVLKHVKLDVAPPNTAITRVPYDVYLHFSDLQFNRGLWVADILTKKRGILEITVDQGHWEWDDPPSRIACHNPQYYKWFRNY